MIREKVVEEIRQQGYDLLLPEEAAAIARVSITTIYRAVGAGRLQAKRVSGAIRIDRQVFLRWLDEGSSG